MAYFMLWLWIPTMPRRHCCIVGCHSSGRKLTAWLDTVCDIHGIVQWSCIRDEPFKLHPFLTEKKETCHRERMDKTGRTKSLDSVARSESPVKIHMCSHCIFWIVLPQPHICTQHCSWDILPSELHKAGSNHHQAVQVMPKEHSFICACSRQSNKWGLTMTAHCPWLLQQALTCAYIQITIIHAPVIQREKCVFPAQGRRNK